jgi:hypothetical protein
MRERYVWAGSGCLVERGLDVRDRWWGVVRAVVGALRTLPRVALLAVCAGAGLGDGRGG